ncbi:unnamed protein product [Sphagnum jensenii]
MAEKGKLRLPRFFCAAPLTPDLTCDKLHCFRVSPTPMKVKDVIRKGRGVRRGSGFDEVDAEILVGSSACQNVVGFAIRADREAQLVEIERLEREANTGRLEREILKCKVERMQRIISLQSLVDDWLGMPTTKALNKKIMKGIDNEYHASAKDVKMTQLQKFANGSFVQEVMHQI